MLKNNSLLKYTNKCSFVSHPANQIKMPLNKFPGSVTQWLCEKVVMLFRKQITTEAVAETAAAETLQNTVSSLPLARTT